MDRTTTDADRGGAPQGEVRLWLDDIRDPARFGCIGWTWVTTAEAAIDLLKTGRVVEASLDHDLSIAATIGVCDWNTEVTGYDVVCWMEEHDVWPRDGTRVHSMNPEGRRRMEFAIASAARRRATATPKSAVSVPAPADTEGP